jgi:hypothetical protein
MFAEGIPSAAGVPLAGRIIHPEYKLIIQINLL